MRRTAEQELGRIVALTEGRRAGSEDDKKPSALARTVGVASTALVVSLFVFVVFVAYGSTVDNRWYKVVAIEGASMEPTIRSGDAIVITRPPERLEEGMVVVLEVEGRLVTHRVVAVEERGRFTTRGDANVHADDWADLDVRVAGVVRGRIPFLGRALRLVGTGAWFNQRVQAPTNAAS